MEGLGGLLGMLGGSQPTGAFAQGANQNALMQGLGGLGQQLLANSASGDSFGQILLSSLPGFMQQYGAAQQRAPFTFGRAQAGNERMQAGWNDQLNQAMQNPALWAPRR